MNACEHPVDKGNVITDTLRKLSEVSQMTSKMTSEKCKNEPRSEELCGSGRKFQLSWKAKYNWIEYNTDKRRVFCSACTIQILSSCKCPLREDSYAAFVPRLQSYLRSTMTQEWLNHIGSVTQKLIRVKIDPAGSLLVAIIDPAGSLLAAKSDPPLQKVIRVQILVDSSLF